MGTQAADFNALQFEKKLTSLKDSQDSINSCCQWCLQNRQHHKKIVNVWLNVLKRVKVEQRLILFYLANDVIQYAKRKNYDFVESWGTALQKATTMVRDDRVKHKILRIFKIWEQRGIYNEEFIADLSGLISVVPSAHKGDEAHEFQATYVVNKIKSCSTLENQTEIKLKALKEHNPRIQIEAVELCASLKERAHVDDVEKEIDVYVTHMEDYINTLKIEIKNRIALISVLKQAETQLESDRKDVKMVANAYKMFGQRVKTFQKKLEEHKEALSSPVPSPDINAPSPSPDSDCEDASAVSQGAYGSFSNAGFYTPQSTVEASSNNSFLQNGSFSTFLGSSLPFNLSGSNLFNNGGGDATGSRAPMPVAAPLHTNNPVIDYPYTSGTHVPLLPPPMPPFTGSNSYSAYSNSTSGGDFWSNNKPQMEQQASYNDSEDYNPEQDVDTWETDPSWLQDLENPDSPPNFDRDDFHEDDLDSGSSHGKDVCHHNLISLTGSPNHSPSTPSAPKPVDCDYRMPFTLATLKLPPPPPPKASKDHASKSPIKDNVESIDMDLSEDEAERPPKPALKVVVDASLSLEPPPPLPDLPDDVDANNFLDDLNNDLNDFSNLSADDSASKWQTLPLPSSYANPAPNYSQWEEQPPGTWDNGDDWSYNANFNSRRGHGGLPPRNFHKPLRPPRMRGGAFRGGSFRSTRGRGPRPFRGGGFRDY